MFVHRISERVVQYPTADWNRRLFDSLIPLPDGTSYNAYLIKGSEKTALIDTTEPAVKEGLLKRLESVPAIDYLVSNHAEQDHSGAIPHILARYPRAKLVVTPKAKPMLMDLLHVPEEAFITVADGETISLGDRTLEFIHLPWVHWPETMGVYLREERILFSCDFFGSHMATSELYAPEDGQIYEAAKRYYAEIMMPFARHIAKNLEKLEKYPIEIIAPSHGPIYRRPAFILDAYRDWISETPKNLVVLPYVSMHDSTRIMAEHLTDALVERGVIVQPFDLAVTDIGKLAIALVDAATIVIGAPTVLGGPHPNAVYAAVLANALRPKAKFVSIIGSYLWGGKTVEILSNLISNLKVEILEPVYIKGLPRAEDLAALTRLAETIAQRHRAAGVLA